MPLSTSQYRQKPVAQHDAQEKTKYVRDLRRLHGDKMKKGRKVKINLRGKNVDAVIEQDLKPSNTSVMVNINGKVMRKDLASVYGVEGMSDVEESAPPSKLLELKSKRAGTPRKLLLEAKARPKTPKRNARQRKKNIVKSAGTPRKKVAEGKPPKRKYNPTGKKQATNIDDEIKNLMSVSNKQGNGR
tara:strand:+ start:508 stop:1068 length:561 start_codon:yes stop_codon:yes gene_type:complete